MLWDPPTMAHTILDRKRTDPAGSCREKKTGWKRGDERCGQVLG